MLSSWLHNCIFIHAINLPGPGNIFLLPWTFGNCVLYMVYGSTSFSVLEIFFFSYRDHWPGSSNCRNSSQSWSLEVTPEKEGLVQFNWIPCSSWHCWLLPQENHLRPLLLWYTSLLFYANSPVVHSLPFSCAVSSLPLPEMCILGLFSSFPFYSYTLGLGSLTHSPLYG